MRVTLLGSDTLKRFTNDILNSGLSACGCEVTNDMPSRFAIIQIHGSPASKHSDLEIIQRLPELCRAFQSCIILLHRPDEIRDTLPHLRAVLDVLPPTTGLVMLGDLLVDDPFYHLRNIPLRIIPHGFFQLRSEAFRERVIIGSHTTWGELRSVKRTLLLLKTIGDLESKVLGYVGGSPVNSIQLETILNILDELEMRRSFTLQHLYTERWREQLSSAPPSTIFLNPGAANPDFDLTFNVQLYHYGHAIRLGESSGSLHASAGIPVIFEMNGSERLENLRVIKVPYSDATRVDSADLQTAAREIVGSIRSTTYQDMLAHNRSSASIWDARHVAQLYIDFFRFLASLS